MVFVFVERFRYYLLLEANFVEPAHDKQGFERTAVPSRLEAWLITMQKNYWFVFNVTLTLNFL